MKKSFKRLTGIFLTMTMIIALIPQCAMAKNVEDYHTFLSNFNTGAVKNNPPYEASFTLDKRTLVQAVTTYHWNGGKGKAPGTIRILKDDVVDGEWTAAGRSSSGVENTLWDIFPDYIMEPGHHYTIEPSSYDTWSYNEASGERGFLELRGYAVSDDFTVSGSSGSSSSGSKSSSSSSGSASTGYKCSDWARAEVESAQSYGLIPSELKNADLTRPMNRKNFAAVSVNAYGYMSGESVSAASNPFTDTSDTDVLRAYNAGIINGTSDTTFSPDMNVTREQAATMLTRAYKKIVLSGWTLKTDGDYALNYTNTASFSDGGSISDFAKDSVFFMASKGIVKGVDDSHFDPSNSVTAEQALAIAVRMIKNLDTSPQENTKTNTKVQSGETQPAKGDVKFDDITVTFTSGNSGNVTMTKESSLTDTPDGSTTAVYDIALDTIPSEPVVLAFDAPALTDGSQYAIKIGVPVKDADGNRDTLWSAAETTYENGKAKASVYLGGIDEFVSSVSGDGFSELTPVLTELGAKVGAAGTSAVKTALTKEVTFTSGSFMLHVPKDIYIDPSDKLASIYFSDADAQNLLDDMNHVISEYSKEYDLSARSKWPMDAYLGKPFAGALGAFSMPSWSLNGRISSSAVNSGEFTLKKEALAQGYKKKISSDREVYGTISHELFHFVQRCYYAQTDRWWDESSATFYHALMKDKAGYKEDNPGEWLDQNYWEPAVAQYEIIKNTLTTTTDNDYARMPFFHYCMKQNEHFLRNAFNLLKDNKFQQYQNVISEALGKSMQEIMEGYFISLVCKGELYSVKNQPWDIYDDLIGTKGLSTVYGNVGRVITPGTDGETVFAALPAYGAGFAAMDMSALPANVASIDLTARDAEIIDITILGRGYSSDNIRYTLHSDGKVNLQTDGTRHLLMLLNCSDKVVSSAITISHNKLASSNLPTAKQSSQLAGSYSGHVVFYKDGEYYSKPAAATVSSDLGSIKVAGDGISFTVSQSYNTSTGMFGSNAMIRPSSAWQWQSDESGSSSGGSSPDPTPMPDWDRIDTIEIGGSDTAGSVAGGTIDIGGSAFSATYAEEETPNPFSQDEILMSTITMRIHYGSGSSFVVFSGSKD